MIHDKVCQKQPRCAPPFSDNLKKTGGGFSTTPPPSRAKVKENEKTLHPNLVAFHTPVSTHVESRAAGLLTVAHGHHSHARCLYSHWTSSCTEVRCRTRQCRCDVTHVTRWPARSRVMLSVT